MTKKKITKNIYIEDLIENYPFSAEYLLRNGIRCIVCGEVIWGTLKEACEEKGFDDKTTVKFVKELNELKKQFEEKVKNELRNLRIKTDD